MKKAEEESQHKSESQDSLTIKRAEGNEKCVSCQLAELALSGQCCTDTENPQTFAHIMWFDNSDGCLLAKMSNN